MSSRTADLRAAYSRAGAAHAAWASTPRWRPLTRRARRRVAVDAAREADAAYLAALGSQPAVPTIVFYDGEIDA